MVGLGKTKEFFFPGPRYSEGGMASHLLYKCSAKGTWPFTGENGVKAGNRKVKVAPDQKKEQQRGLGTWHVFFAILGLCATLDSLSPLLLPLYGRQAGGAQTQPPELLPKPESS